MSDIFAKPTAVNGAKAAVVPTAETAAPIAAQPDAATGVAVANRSAAMVAEATAVQLAKPAMPWYHAGCKACSGNPVPGINANGKPCRMCDIKQGKADLPTSVDFEFDADDDGNYIAVNKVTNEVTEVSVIASEVKATEKVEVPPAKAEAPIPQAEPEPEPEPELPIVPQEKVKTTSPFPPQATADLEPEPAAEEVDDVQSSKVTPKAGKTRAQKTTKGGRPRVGFTLYVGCAPMGTNTVTLEALFEELASEIAVDQGVDSYYQLDSFKRKDAFGLIASQLNNRYAKFHIVARYASPGTDVGAFLAALRSVVSPSRLVEALAA